MSESYQRTANSGDAPNQPVQAPSKTADQGVSEKAQQRPDVAGDDSVADKPPAPDQDYPEQKHAGAVGYGPNYLETHGHVTVGERLDGLKEEIKGRITRNHDVVKEGHDKRTGEAKRRQLEEEQDPENAQKAFQEAERKKKEQEGQKSEADSEKPAPMEAEEKAADEKVQDENPASTKSRSFDQSNNQDASRVTSQASQ